MRILAVDILHALEDQIQCLSHLQRVHETSYGAAMRIAAGVGMLLARLVVLLILLRLLRRLGGLLLAEGVAHSVGLVCGVLEEGVRKGRRWKDEGEVPGIVFVGESVGVENFEYGETGNVLVNKELGR